jgi:hypothetical protein
MTLENELTELTKRYLAAELPLDDLYMWVQNRQEAIAEFPDESFVNRLAGSIMLASVELFNGDRDAASARQELAEDYANLMGASSRP